MFLTFLYWYPEFLLLLTWSPLWRCPLRPSRTASPPPRDNSQKLFGSFLLKLWSLGRGSWGRSSDSLDSTPAFCSSSPKGLPSLQSHLNTNYHQLGLTDIFHDWQGNISSWVINWLRCSSQPELNCSISPSREAASLLLVRWGSRTAADDPG